MNEDVKSQTQYRCAGCRDNTNSREFFPFCSKRCKLIDLGAWAAEEYVVEGKPTSTSLQENELPNIDLDS